MIIHLKYVRINVYSFCFYITGNLMLYKGRMTFVKIKKRVIAKYIWRNQNKYISIGIALSVMMIFSLIQIGESISLQYRTMLTTSYSYDVALKNLSESEEKKVVTYLENQKDMENYGYERDILWVDIPKHKEYEYSFLSVYKEGHSFPAWSIDITEGKTPKKAYEIVLDQEVAQVLGVSVGDCIKLPIHESQKLLECTVVGMYASADLPDEMSDCTWILVSNLTKDALEKDGIKLEMNTTAMTATIAKGDYVEEKVEKLASELRTVLNPHYDDWLQKEVQGQKVTGNEGKQYEDLQERVCVNLQKKDIIENAKIGHEQFLWIAVLALVVAISMILLIYNNISLMTKKRMREYSILRCIGMDHKYLRKLLWIEIGCYAGIGIPFGIILGNVLNAIVAKRIISYISGNDIGVIQSPYSYFIAIGISIVAIVIANLQMLFKIKDMTPIEGMNYPEGSFFKKKVTKRATKRKKLINFLVKRNIERNFGKSMIVVVSLTCCMTLLLVIVYFGTAMRNFLMSEDCYKQKISDFETYIEAESVAYNNPEAKNSEYVYPENIEKDVEISGIRQCYRFNDFSYTVEDGKKGDYIKWSGNIVLFDDAMLQKLKEDYAELQQLDLSKEILIYVSLDDYQLKNLKNGKQAENNCYIDKKQEVILNIAAVDNYEDEFLEKMKLSARLKGLNLKDKKWAQSQNSYFIANEKLIKRLYGTVGYNHILFSTIKDKNIKQRIKDIYVKNVNGAVFNNYKLGSEEDQRLLKGVICLLVYLVVSMSLAGFSNMSNTMKANLMTRRRENGIMRALGMTQKMEKRMIIKENLRLVTYALIASFILGFIINTVIILVFMGEFTFYWYVYIVLAILFFVMSTCVLELTLQRQYQHSIIENLIRDE